MAKRSAGTKNSKQATDGQKGDVIELTKELFHAAITLRASVETADYTRYVLPIIFLRLLSLRYDRRREDLEALVAGRGVREAHFEPFIARFIQQAEAHFAEWPLVA